MKIGKLIAQTTAVLLFGGLVAHATVLTFGTKWTLVNETDQGIVVACERQASDDGVTIHLEPTSIPAKSSLEYAWGDAWHNDGMGLNPGLWACRAGVEGAAAADAGTFKTDWGEPAQLNVSRAGQDFVITKTSVPGAVAKGEAHDGSSRR